MSAKSKRMIELMMTVNRMRKFTVQELAYEFNVSTRTILRDLQELSELGVPLYSEVGRHGGYQVLNERVLPPIAFTEQEAVAIFFASHALRHFSALPFETQSLSALKKFYAHLPSDVKDRIDQMKNRFDFLTPTRQTKSPYLSVLLEAAIEQRVISVDYASGRGISNREIQPIGIYANSGLWYCPAYCFARYDFRLFRCDKILSVSETSTHKPMDLQRIHLGNRETVIPKEKKVRLQVELNKEGVLRCEGVLDSRFKVNIREDGTGWIDNQIQMMDAPFLAHFFIGLGNKAEVKSPAALVDLIKKILFELIERYTIK
ncbi:helix-turn-helix transcriptional regulator [Shimazuella kribbensis]|uniref:helix-turn-helix transcriptional regulator n=1 Tax=Shimazuella kribbensis TaxID=139808 RepID=UPI0004248FA3|nr:YafY family protein [Shimazuella kribbensis]